MDGKVKRRMNMAKKNIKYNCKTCGVEVETRVIGEGFAYWSRQCPYCYSQSLIAKPKTVTLTLTDSDLWGLQSAIIHGQTDGYFNDNMGWSISMYQRVL
jgi:DNA-directed RNA polymerase subunit RPC12/RpoP